MSKLGTSKHPAIIRVQTMERANEIMAISEERGWKVIVGIEPDKREDISDFLRLMNKSDSDQPALLNPNRPPRPNEFCPCGSGMKYKKCCGQQSV